MSIIVGRFLNTVVVTLRGVLDTLAAARLAATLVDLIDGQGNLAVALDLRGLERVHPSGLQVIYIAAARIERRGGALRLSGPNDRVLRALDGAGLSRLVRDAGRSDRQDRQIDRKRRSLRERPSAFVAAIPARAADASTWRRAIDPERAERDG